MLYIYLEIEILLLSVIILSTINELNVSNCVPFQIRLDFEHMFPASACKNNAIVVENLLLKAIAYCKASAKFMELIDTETFSKGVYSRFY